MSYQGYSPSLSPLTQAQAQPAADPLYMRLDGANSGPGWLKNALINPSFDIWQRGISPGTLFVADRWYSFNGGNGTLTTERYALTPGEAPTESQFAIRLKQTGRTTGYGVFGQTIEGVWRFAGKRVAVSALVRSAAAGTFLPGCNMDQDFGSGGSSQVPLSFGSLPSTTTWQRVVIGYANIPSIAGKVIGTNSAVQFRFYTANGDFQIDMTDFEVKEVIPGYGDQIPPFERVPREIDFVRCKRFYQRVPAQALRGIASQVNVVNRFGCRFETPMRVTPTLTPNGLVVYDGRVTPTLTITVNYSGAEGIDVDGQPSVSVAQYSSIIGIVGTIDASAEL